MKFPQIRPSWSEVMGIEQFEEQFEIKFQGIGWYFCDRDTILVTEVNYGFEIFVWNEVGVKNKFDQVVRLPIRIVHINEKIQKNK